MLDKRKLKYRHPNTVDLTVLMWTLDVQFGKWIKLPSAGKSLCHIDAFFLPELEGLYGIYLCLLTCVFDST